MPTTRAGYPLNEKCYKIESNAEPERKVEEKWAPKASSIHSTFEYIEEESERSEMRENYANNFHMLLAMCI